MNTITSDLEKKLVPIMPKIQIIKNNRKLPFCNLDLSFETIDEIKGLKTRLFQHQKTAIRAMIDLENKRTLNIGDYTIDYNMAFLTDPVGSGKSVDILGLILANDVSYISNITCYNNNHIPPHIEVKHFDLPKVKSNVIIVNNTVIKQWEKTIKEFTDLKYFIVENLASLREFLKFDVKKIDTYDIILVKHGKTNGIITYEGNIYKDAYIYDMINIKNIIWQRFIVDDFDSIKLNTHFQNLKANFTWYISSTKRKVAEYNHYPVIPYEAIHEFNNCAKFIIKNAFLYDVVNVKNDLEYLKSSLTLPSINFYLVRIKNKDDIFLNMLTEEFEYDDKIVELMNSDSIKKLSSVLHIKANSIDEVFEKIIGNKYNTYNKAFEIIEFINNIKKNVTEINDSYTYSKTNLLNMEMPNFINKKINNLLATVLTEHEDIKKDIQTQIERLKSHIRHNTCPICYGDLNTDECSECIIIKCCNQILCFNCAMASFHIKKIYDLTSNFSCPTCRACVCINDIIYLGQKIEIFNQIKDCKEITKINSSTINKTEEEYSNKFDSLIKLFNNNLCGKKVDITMNNILKGTIDNEMPLYKKVIIFASDMSVLHDAQNKLNDFNIKNWRLFGTTKEIYNISESFKQCEDNCAILINSENHCSGLNLQSATDIVFLHNILNIHIEEQTIGRGYRIGRTYPLNVWYFQYNNEYCRMKKNHIMTEID